MTYQELFGAVKNTLETTDTKGFGKEFAVQVNIEGEGEGIFYIAYKNGALEIQPYDYKDRTATLYATSAALVAITASKATFGELIGKGEIRIEGEIDGALAEAFEKASAKKAKAAKAESKPAAKTETKPAAKAEAKTEAKPAPKAEVKAEVKTEAKPAPKAEVKAEAKTEAKPAPKAEVKTELKTAKKVETEPAKPSKPAAKPVKPAQQHSKHGKHGKN